MSPAYVSGGGGGARVSYYSPEVVLLPSGALAVISLGMESLKEKSSIIWFVKKATLQIEVSLGLTES